MTISGAEIFLAFSVVFVGAIGNIKLFLKDADMIKQKKWSLTIYGIPIIVVICALFTPQDIISNIVFSVPLSVVYVLVFRLIIFKRLDFGNSLR